MSDTAQDLSDQGDTVIKAGSPHLSDIESEVLRLRLSMLVINEQIKKKAFSVPIHLAFGHEAIAAAVGAAMQPADRLLLTHRNIHYNLARNPNLARQIDEYRLLESGLAGGRDGAMNLTNPEAGILYTSSILANCLPVATGVAMAQKVEGNDAVTLVVTGDGALEEGAFYETLLIANSLNLPLIVIIENNQWSMHTRIEERRCALDLQAMAGAFAMDMHKLAGNDADHYRDELQSIRAQVLATQKPCLVEVTLSTLGDFTVPDDASPSGRLINYHHGAAPHVSMDKGPVIEASERDPIHLIAEKFADLNFRQFTDELRDDLMRGLP